MEISPDKSHENMTFATYLGDGITFVLSGVFLKYTRDAYLFLIILGATTIFCVLVLTIMLPESPRFLYSKRRYDELN
jgi:hypothetical protein